MAKNQKNNGGDRDGSVVGYQAKSQEDCTWTPLKVLFYKALKSLPEGRGTSKEIAAKSSGKVDAGHARHFGYHGVGAGYVKVERSEETRGFIFALTAAGRKLDPEKELAKSKEAKKEASE